jgi:hypothetical protein
MASWTFRVVVASLLMASSALAQTTNDPFSLPIPAADGVLSVNVVEFATLPDVDGQPARMMLLVDEPGTGRLFVNDMHGLLYGVSYDGSSPSRSLDVHMGHCRLARWSSLLGSDTTYARIRSTPTKSPWHTTTLGMSRSWSSSMGAVAPP